MLDTESVRPAIAGGCAPKQLDYGRLSHPPAIAGGTDCVQHWSLTFEGKALRSSHHFLKKIRSRHRIVGEWWDFLSDT